MSALGDDSIEEWRIRYDVVSAIWAAVLAAEQDMDVATVEQWMGKVGRLRARQRELEADGLWRAGPRTLLAAIDVHYRELAMTAGVAWLLRPDGHHGLGSAVLARLLDHLGVPPDVNLAQVKVVLEEARAETRADLVVYGDTWTVIIEAKTFAVEQVEQLDRLHRHWSDERSPTFVFLTRGRREATTAVLSRGHWKTLTWLQIAEIVRNAAAERAHVAAGALDYVETLEAYHNA